MDSMNSEIIFNKKRKVKMESKKCESDESDCEIFSADENQYERLTDEQEHVEAVVIQKDVAQENENRVECDLSNENGKIILNLSAEQIGNNKNNGYEKVDIKKQRSASVGVVEAKTLATSLPRKSSLRRASVYTSPTDFKSISFERPKALLDINKTELYDVPKRIIMPIINEGQDFMDISTFYNDEKRLNLNEILTIYDQRPSISGISDTSSLQSTAYHPHGGISDKYKCGICKKLYSDPRVLDCLHMFCKQCLMDLDTTKNNGSNLFWRKISENGDSDMDFSANENNKTEPSFSRSTSVSEQFNESKLDALRSSLANFKGRKFSRAKDKNMKERNSSTVSFNDKPKQIICPLCGNGTEIAIGGIMRLPQNFVMMRKVDEILLKGNTEDNKILCQLCCNDVVATSSCLTCSVKLCSFCKEAHKRQRSTANHEVKLLAEIARKARKSESTLPSTRRIIKCPMHLDQELKLFCTTCHQVICNDCTILLHRGHKCTTTLKAGKVYMKLVKNAMDQTKPMTDYANLSIAKLSDMSKKINNRCATVHVEVENYLADYFSALEAHRQTLLNQIERVRDSKMEMVHAYQADLEKRSQEAKTAISFAEEILNDGTEVEGLIFVNILMKRFQQCQKSELSSEFRIKDSLQFLPDEKAPSNSDINHIPLYGIITTQKVSAKHSGIENVDGLMNLRVHKKSEIILLTKDSADQQMCHGGLLVDVELRYMNSSMMLVQTQVLDKRDGTYIISFIPEAPGMMQLNISIAGKAVYGSPFQLRARNLRPHSGIYHCCTFCSSNGNKQATCACESEMPGGYQGCGHGHEGHPGRRHWSCCANVLENSECSVANAVVCQLEEDH